jgi:cobalt/nickel transport system ATP-binding protein
MLEVSGLTVLYSGPNEVPALNDLSFSIGEGEKVALVGANGAGKSTLLLSLVGILDAAAGKVEVDGIVLQKKNLPLIRRKLGLLFQNPDDQLFMPTVYDDVIFGPQNYAENLNGAEAERIGAEADKMLERLGISRLKDRMTHKLSGGEKRLAALAGVLIMEPSFLLMDEPSAFLDPRARRGIISIIEALTKACLIATHDLDMALRLCDRCLLLNNGRLCADGPAKDIIGNRKLLDECGL